MVGRWLRQVAEPRGRSRARDALGLRIWDGYALFRGSRRPRTRRTDEGTPRVLGRYEAAFFRDHLLQNVVPFWARHSIDPTGNGFLHHLERDGRVFDASARYAAMQARMVWSFSAAYRADPRPEYLDAATAGARFLAERMWDERDGGVFRSVGPNGEVREPIKRLVDQAFALLGLTEHHRVSGDPLSRARVGELLDHVERHAWDTAHGGYVESCERDWTLRSALKTACIHDDMLTAMLAVAEVMPEPRHEERVATLADLLMHRLTVGRPPRLVEKCRASWTYSPAATMDTLEIGHNLKGAWALTEVHRRTGRLDCLEAAARLTDFCLARAWDERNGGFFHAVFRGGRLASDEKLWWTQCEGILALAALWSLTGEPRYRTSLDRLVDFCVAHFIDPEFGEWYASCGPDGTVRDPRKGHRWKAAYHPVRAGLYAWRALEEVEAASAPA